MNELSLFSGAGGGLLATKYLLNWRTIGYVEINDYCQRIIKQRIKDGLLDDAPIFSDIRAFINEGFAKSYKGMVDVITAGFPCQPFSVAGGREAEEDDRNMWPRTMDVINITKPKFIFLENVPGLLSFDYIFTILEQLSENNYKALPPLMLGAVNIGAPHKRERIWIMAYHENKRTDGGKRIKINATRKSEKRRYFRERSCPNRRNKDQQLFSRSRWWGVEPKLGRVANGVAHRMDRLKAIGNGQVSEVVGTAWDLLTLLYEDQ